MLSVGQSSEIECTISLLVFYLSSLLVCSWDITYFHFDVHMGIFVINLMWASKWKPSDSTNEAVFHSLKGTNSNAQILTYVIQSPQRATFTPTCVGGIYTTIIRERKSSHWKLGCHW
jgi:hypothetical protein